MLEPLLDCSFAGSKLAHNIIENKLAACVNQIPGPFPSNSYEYLDQLSMCRFLWSLNDHIHSPNYVDY